MPRLLLIEDETALREEITQLLTFEGYEVRSAENGLIGTQVAQEYLPDLIICDVMMPYRDGYEVLHHVRSDPLTRAIPFIFLTAKVERTSQRHGMALGAEDYLTKPFTADELLTAVHVQLSKRAQNVADTQQQLEYLRGLILTTIPHELRTPLSGIIGFAEILSLDGANLSSQEIIEFGQSILNSGVRLYHLVENCLTYLQIEMMSHDTARLGELRRAAMLHPTLIIEQTVRAIAEKYDRVDDLHVRLDKSGDLSVIEAHLTKVVGEIVDNAFKFSKRGKPVAITGTHETTHYRLRIADKGKGIQPDQLARFDVLTQFDRKQQEQQGLGLGLIIARRLVEIHGGRLTVESERGQGTTVQIELALAARE
ncbi:MAG: response regulator [Anaerolineae bacterium]|nr:response regulator [Anaerolineae bacterium]